MIDAFRIAVDADEDIASFDPFSPSENSSQSIPGMSTTEASNDFYNIAHVEKSKQRNGYEADDSELLRSREVIVKSRGDSSMASSPNDKRRVRLSVFYILLFSFVTQQLRHGTILTIFCVRFG